MPRGRLVPTQRGRAHRPPRLGTQGPGPMLCPRWSPCAGSSVAHPTVPQTAAAARDGDSCPAQPALPGSADRSHVLSQRSPFPPSPQLPVMDLLFSQLCLLPGSLPARCGWPGPLPARPLPSWAVLWPGLCCAQSRGEPAAAAGGAARCQCWRSAHSPSLPALPAGLLVSAGRVGVTGTGCMGSVCCSRLGGWMLRTHVCTPRLPCSSVGVMRTPHIRDGSDCCGLC